MIQAVVTNKVWIKLSDLSPLDIYFAENDCTIVSRFADAKSGESKIVRLFERRGQWLGLPRHYFLNEFRTKTKKTFQIDDSRVGGLQQEMNLPDIDPRFTLRPEDQAIDVPEFLSKLRSIGSFGGGLFDAYTGYGKSVSIANFIKELGGPALIVVHLGALANQWQVNLQTYFPGIKVGLIQGDQIEYEGFPISVAMVQSLMNPEKYPQEMWSYFRTVIFDEVHRMGAERFGSVAPMLNCRWHIGTSGTLRRADGMENVYHHCIGKRLHKASEINRLHPKVFLRETHWKMPKNVDLEKAGGGNGRSLVLKLASLSKPRAELIAQDILKAISTPGRHPLVMSERLDMLRRIAEVFDSLQKAAGFSFTIGFFIGGKDKEEQAQAAACDVVFATIQAAKEGIDIPRLNTLFLASPINDTEQLIGRVCRKKQQKEPFVLFYADSLCPTFRRSLVENLRLFRGLKWSVSGREKLRVPVLEEELNPYGY